MPNIVEHIRAVAFDLDGTLIDTMGDLAGAVNLTLTLLGTRQLPEGRIRSFIGNGIEQLMLRSLSESLDTQMAHPAQSSAALALFRRNYAQALFQRSQVFPGVVEALQSLQEAGVALCCITNKHSAFSEPLLEQAGLARFFAFTLCADRPEDRKPSPHLLLAACARFAISPADMLYVGDSGIDIEAARAAGCPVVTVTYGYGGNHHTSTNGADKSVETLTDLL